MQLLAFAQHAGKVRERFRTRGVRIIRNYAGPNTPKQRDLWKLKRWDEMFRTTDRAIIEEKCRENEFEPTWLDGDRLRKRVKERLPDVLEELVQPGDIVIALGAGDVNQCVRELNARFSTPAS